MLTVFTVRALLLVAALVVVGVAAMPADADDKKTPPKMPPTDAKEWKKHGDMGLQVWDATEGKGDVVKPGAMVKIHYTGWTTDGKMFDSSLTGGEPATFPLTSLIKGWQEGIPGMKAGGKRRLIIPSALGYGDAGSPPDIPGKATLVFEIELIRHWSIPDVDAKEWKEVKDTGGLKVWDVKEGKGDAVKEGAEVTIHYTGWTLNGTMFDSSYKRDEPATFPLGRLIKGWQIGVPGMKPGGVRRLSIPYPLAYGEAGKPPTIPAKATLIFEIEVVEKQK